MPRRQPLSPTLWMLWDQGPNVKQKAPDADSAGNNKFQVGSASVVCIVKASPRERGLLQKTHIITKPGQMRRILFRHNAINAPSC